MFILVIVLSGYVLGGLHYVFSLLLLFELCDLLLLYARRKIPDKLVKESMDSKISKFMYFNKDSTIMGLNV